MLILNQWLVDLLIEFDEFGFQPTVLMGVDAEEFAIAWKKNFLKALEVLIDENH